MSEEFQDPYCYPGTNVLINIPGYTNPDQLEVFENQMVGRNLFRLKELPIQTKDPTERLQETHRRVFEDVFEWAGKYRAQMGLITKARLGQRVVYCNAQFIPTELARVMGELKQENMLKGLDKGTFANRMSYFYGELDAVHPFREGNSRTFRQFTSDIARNAGYQLDWSKTASSENGQNKLYEARDRAVLKRDTSGLEKIILEGLSPLNEKTKTQSSGLQSVRVGSNPKRDVAEVSARESTQNRLNSRMDITTDAKKQASDFLNRPESEKIWKSQALDPDGRIAAARVLGGESTFDQATKDLPEIQHGVVRALARGHARGQGRSPENSL